MEDDDEEEFDSMYVGLPSLIYGDGVGRRYSLWKPGCVQ